jgi:hypothetical protein
MDERRRWMAGYKLETFREIAYLARNSVWRGVFVVVISTDRFVFALCVDASRFLVELANSGPELGPCAVRASGEEDAIAARHAYHNVNAANGTSLISRFCHDVR